jgi:hypothetical protein
MGAVMGTDGVGGADLIWQRQLALVNQKQSQTSNNSYFALPQARIALQYSWK